MNEYENFPTPADIAPEAFKAPDLDLKWEATAMDEVAAFLYKKRVELQAKQHVKFIPASKRDMGHSRAQWLHFQKHIADLVRERGWTVSIVENGTFPCLDISMPQRVEDKTEWRMR